jgi:hypothetical protein
MKDRFVPTTQLVVKSKKVVMVVVRILKRRVAPIKFIVVLTDIRVINRVRDVFVIV